MIVVVFEKHLLKNMTISFFSLSFSPRPVDWELLILQSWYHPYCYLCLLDDECSLFRHASVFADTKLQRHLCFLRLPLRYIDLRCHLQHCYQPS